VLLHEAGPDQANDYARRLSERDGIRSVVGPAATYIDGVPVASGQADREDGGLTWLTAAVDHEPFGTQAQQLVRDLRQGPAPGRLSIAGDSAVLVDTQASLLQRLPWAVALIALTTLVLLFLFTGSVIIPIKALVMNTLSLTASFGAAVLVFQQGHLRWLVGDFTPTGFLEITVPVLMFCIAFGLSMDYEVFLLSRIRERYLATGDNEEAVSAGLANTGRLISAAAAVVAAVLLVLATSSLSLLKLLGVGLAAAVVVDAVLVRGILVPASMKLLGSVNWWAPRWLRAVSRRFGLREAA
jgi:RND superfamily putative drug exporter